MPIASPRYRLTEGIIASAPDDPGVYVLYSGDELIYFGHAIGAATIRTRLLAHLAKLAEPSQATHYAWEISRDPLKRVAELVREYQGSFKRRPRYNTPSAPSA